MAYALDNFIDRKRPQKVEHIELQDFQAPGIVTRSKSDERRLSNRTHLDSVLVDRLIRRQLFRIWDSVKSVPCVLTNISFTGIGIESKDLIRIGDTVELSLESIKDQATQILPVRICNHYRTESGAYSYGGELEQGLNADFRRLIVTKLTSL